MVPLKHLGTTEKKERIFEVLHNHKVAPEKILTGGVTRSQSSTSKIKIRGVTRSQSRTCSVCPKTVSVNFDLSLIAVAF